MTKTEQTGGLFVSVCLAGLLSACGAPVDQPGGPGDPVVKGQGPPSGWAFAEGRDLPLDAGRSRIAIKVYRGGRLAHLGHNHLLEVRKLRGRLRRLDSGGGAAELVFRVADILVDDPTGRAQAGPDFAKQPEPDAVAGTRRNMLGDGVLDAVNWPEVQISARVGNLNATESTARIFIHVRGVSNGYETPVQIESGAGEVRVSGSLTLNQRDFGITPFAVLGGALRVQDAIRADFVVVGRKSGDAMW